MGRLLGSHADDTDLDRADLNKCPDCGCYFAGDNCPLCGKECPEHMRAGNRPVVKQPKRKRHTGPRSVVFIDWYHSWWFIIIMMLLFPLVGIILLITSPHEKWKKLLFAAIAVIYMAISSFGMGRILSNITEAFTSPVNDSLIKEEYIDKCQPVTAEAFYRMSESYRDQFVCIKLRIVTRVTYVDQHHTAKDYICYLCESENGSDFRIVVRDCLLENEQRFIPGDVITVYGEGADECEVYDSEYNSVKAPCLNMAYVTAP